LKHSVLHFLHSLTPPRFDCMDRHQHPISLSLWLPCGLNQSGNTWRGAHIPLLWAFQILDAIALLYIRFNVCRAIGFAAIWNIYVPIQVEPNCSVRNAFRCAILINFEWMTDDSPDSADIEYLSSSSREVICGQRWW